MKQIVRSTFLLRRRSVTASFQPCIVDTLYQQPFYSNYGALAIYISFALLVQILMNYAVDSYLSVHYYDYHEDESKLKHFLGNVFGILFSIGGVFILVISFIGYLIFQLFLKKTRYHFFLMG
ncbi:MAG: hypothetical protein IPO03_01415 [Bacteroidetes bacterium]|nr:hypothetical protein [Bacteroidota bacterium]